MFKELKGKKILVLGVALLILIEAIISTMYVVNSRKISKSIITDDPELARAMTYAQVQDGEDATNSDYVKFDAYFLKDLNGDGIAEKIRGTCREIGSDSTLYMNLSVNTNGYVKDGTITINGKNFYMQTQIPKDDQIKDNTISNNTTSIKFNNIISGTTKEVLGNIRSGNYSYDSQKTEALKNNINNYSQVNEIVFTGTHVEDTTGKETKIEKRVSFNVDWYGKAKTSISTSNQTYSIKDFIDKDTENLKLKVNINTFEDYGELMLKKAYVEGTIPVLNGYAPISVTINGTDITQNYDKQTRTFTAQREATVDATGKITNAAFSRIEGGSIGNQYQLVIEYPKESYDTLTENGVELKIPVKAYYEAYNNSNDEFTNPLKTNVAEDIVVATFSNPQGEVALFNIKVGERDSYYLGDYVVKKENVINRYNGINIENKINTKYTVRWEGYTGPQGSSNGIIMKSADEQENTIDDEFVFTDGTSESIANLTSNIGISFSGANNLLNDDGWIKVYDDDTNQLIETFTKDTWNKYSEYNYYTYSMPIKHIRVETSDTKPLSELDVYNVKQLDDEAIYKKYTEAQFSRIKYVKSYLAGYIGGISINTTLHNALYEAPLSDASISINPDVMSTQKTEEHAKIEIKTNADINLRKSWKNGIFLLEFPEAVLKVDINSLEVDDSNVKIVTSELYEENGKQYLKIITENDKPTTYNIKIDAQIYPDPRKISENGYIELYAHNENCENYYYKGTDKYDINGNLNTNENILYKSTGISFIAPNTLLTSEVVKDYNDKSEITVAPKVASVLKTQRTATMQISITNNYSGAVSDINILGKVPFEGNTYVINGGDLGSNFTAVMTGSGITVPDEIKGYTTVYYSEKEAPTKDLNDNNNGWTTGVSDFSKVKSYLICIKDYNMEQNKSYEFSYQIKLPEGLAYNKVAYGHHAIYFNLNTEEGKYAQQTEPNKVGVMIAKKYDLELTKYQKNKEKKIGHAMFALYDEEFNETKTAVTNENGILTIRDLFLDRVYTIKEIKAPDDYELNSDEIQFKIIEENNELKYQLLKGITKNISLDTSADKAKLQISVEEKPKAKVRITKVEKGTDNGISGVTYKITGKGMTDGKYVYTNNSGIANISGIYSDEEYTLQEVTADGYYVATTSIKFVVNNNNETYTVTVKDGDVKSSEILIEDDFPIANFKIENEKVPQYQLQITKKASNKDMVLPNTYFKLQGEKVDETLVTDENGNIILDGLYAYETNDYGVTGEYTLQELYVPNGYVINKDPIKFRVDKTADGYKINILSGSVNNTIVEDNVVKLEITNDPIFRIVKKDGETAELIPNVKFVIYKYQLDENGNEQLTEAVDSKGNPVGEKEIINGFEEMTIPTEEKPIAVYNSNNNDAIATEATNGAEYQIITTDENGEINLDLASGVYKIIEIETLDKYVLPEDEQDRTYYIAVGTEDDGLGYGERGKSGSQVVMSSTGYGNNIYQMMPYEDGYVILNGFKKGEIISGDETANKSAIVIDETSQYLIKYNSKDKVEKIWNTKTEYRGSGNYTQTFDFLAQGVINNKIVVFESLEENTTFSSAQMDNNKEYVVNESGIYQIIINSDMKVEEIIKAGIHKDSSDRITMTEIKATSDGGFIVGLMWSGSGGYERYIEAGYTEKNEQINLNLVNGSNGYGIPGVILKYNSEFKVQNVAVINTTDTDRFVIGITQLTETPDNGYVFIGSYRYNTINIPATDTVDGREISTAKADSAYPFIIKYDENLKVEWLKSPIQDDGIYTYMSYQDMVVDKNGDYIVVGYLNNSDGTAEIPGTDTVSGSPISLAKQGDPSRRGTLVKYRKDGKIEWLKFPEVLISQRDNFEDPLADVFCEIEQLDNGNYVVMAIKTYNFYSGLIVKPEDVENNKKIILNANSYDKNMILFEINSDGLISNLRNIYPTFNNTRLSMPEYGKRTKAFLINGKFYYMNDAISLNRYTLSLKDEKEKAELEVENVKKEYKITTDVEEFNGNKGGSISGEDEVAYEVVKHGNSSTKEIKMVPDENYEIIGITVNSKEYKYTANEDGSYTMPAFTNMNEDKHIVVTYSLKDNKITINKVDKNTKEKLSGATFKLDQIEERSEPNNDEIIGGLADNGQKYSKTSIGDEVTGKLGELTNNGTYYFVQNSDGTYSPTNSKTYQKANGGTAGIPSTTANSYISIDLTGLTGQYAIVVNASCSSESGYDFGYATITENTTAPTYDSTTGRFMYISGTQSVKDYTSTTFDGGKKYYLHLGYRKDSSGDSNNDQVVINSIKLYSATSTTNIYNFVNNNGKYESTNQGKDSTVCNSYIPIDLTNYTGKYNLTINAEISSQSGYDIGYATITENTTRPSYSSSAGRLVNISGTQSAKDYTTVLQGGKMYYLHLGYYKNASTSSGDDKFTVNSINVSLNDSELYHTTVETNSDGQAITQIPFGKYSITETKAPEGYILNSTPTIVEFRSTDGAVHEFTIEDEEKAKLVVHHYIKGTTTKLAEDETSEGTIGEKYTTAPHMDFEKYELEKDSNGEYVLPANASGTYKEGTTEVTYYYVEKQIPLTVHHYIEGTTNKVPLKAGGTADDVTGSGKEGESYTTSAIANDKLSDEYELVEVPVNASGAYSGNEVIVTYYYKKVERKVNLIKYKEDGKTLLAGAKFKINGVNYTTDENGKISTTLNAGTYDVTEIEAPTNYKLPSNPTTKLTVTRDTNEASINITNEKKTGTVTVHHYIEGTTDKVPLKAGGTAADETKTGNVGDMYATKPVDNLSERYELVSEPSNGSGTYIDGNIEVIYYYKTIPTSVIVHHYLEGTTTKLANDVTIDGIVGDNYTTGVATVDNKYELVAIPANANGKMTREQIVVIYYYRVKDTSVLVHHYKEGTSESLSTDVTINGKVDDDYTTSKATDIPSKYELVATPTNATGKMTVAQTVVTYYYRLKSTGVDVHYYKEGTTEKVSNDVAIEGKVDQSYTTKPATDVASKYELVETPANATGTMTEDRITVIYYYRLKDTSVLVHHYLEGTTTKLADDVTINGQVDDAYKTVVATDLLAGKYELVAEPTNKSGTMTEAQIVVIYYYRVKDTSVLVHHYIKDTTTSLSADVTINGKIDDKYTTTKANDIPEQYELVGTPANASGTMTEEQIVVTYYYQLKNYPYTVNYLEKGTDNVLHDAKQGGEQVYGSTVKSSDEKIDIDGYNFDSCDKETLTIGTTNNVINIYYTKRTDLSYKVNYLEKDTNKVLHAPKVQGGMTFDAEVTSSDEVIAIDGYNYDSVDKTSIKITTGENVINIYYTKRNDLSYKVNYLEKDTNKVLHDQKVQGNMTFENVVTSSDEVIAIDGYDYDSVDKESLTITTGENVINIYYTKRIDLSYKVNYLEKGTNKVLHAQKTQDGMTFEDVVTSTDEVIAIDGYNYDSVDKDTLTITTGKNVINIYYTKKDTKVTVHYYEEGTTNKVSEDVEIPGKVFDDYTTTSADDIPSKYELVKEPENKTGTMTEDEITVIYYYRKKATQVIVHYYEENTTNKLSEDVTINGRVDDEYTTISANDIPVKYELVAEPVNKAGNMTEATIEVIYYYRVKDAIVNVRYLEKGTDKVLADQDRLDGKVDEDYETKPKDIDGYQLVEHVGNEKGKFEVEPLTITYYYLYKTKATVQYIDKTTGQILEQSTTEGLEGDDFVTESKDFENYVLVEEPAEKTVKMTKEEQVLKYYYIHISGGVIEKHIDVITGQILANESYEGNEGDEYDISSRTFEGYDLVEDRLPDNAKGTMKVEPIEVIYYYIYRTKVTAEYIDKNTGNKLTEDEVQNGHEGDNYTTERKTFDDYKLVEIPANADGSMTKEDIKVTYYYVHTSGGVIINHIDVKTNKQLLDETKEEGYEGDPYETHEENISGYDLVKEMYPENATGTMTIEPTRVTYYYIKKTEVNVKYIDKETGEEIDVPSNIPGHEGDDYTTEPKDLPGYDLVEEPENKNGTMTADPIDVIYYYRRPAKVIVNYYDEATKEKLADEIEITGHQNDEYTTEQKDIKYYEISKVPENKDGKMAVTVAKDENGKEIVEDTTYVNYYYRKLIFNLRVDKTIASVIVNGQETAINGNLGKVEVHRKDISTANVKVVYKIKVTNDSELTGRANVVENIPSGMTMIADNNPGWTINQTTASIETNEIKPGESREYQVVLGWQNGDSNIGTKENVASIITENEAGFDEQFETDNISRANLIVAVGTGEIPYVAIAGEILMIMISITAGVYVIDKKRK